MVNYNKIKIFLFDKRYKVDRFFLICLLFGLIVLPYTLFFSKISKSDLIEKEATVSSFRISKERNYRGGGLTDNYLEISMLEYPSWIRISRADNGSEEKIISLLNFNHTKFRFLIIESDLKKLYKSSLIKVYSLITEDNRTIINLDSSLFDNDFNNATLKYLSILALLSGMIYFFTFTQKKE